MDHRNGHLTQKRKPMGHLMVTSPYRPPNGSPHQVTLLVASHGGCFELNSLPFPESVPPAQNSIIYMDGKSKRDYYSAIIFGDISAEAESESPLGGCFTSWPPIFSPVHDKVH